MTKYAEFNEKLEKTEWMDEQIKKLEDRSKILTKLVTGVHLRVSKLIELVPEIPVEPKKVEPVKKLAQPVAPARPAATPAEQKPVSKKSEDSSIRLATSLAVSFCLMSTTYM